MDKRFYEWQYSSLMQAAHAPLQTAKTVQGYFDPEREDRKPIWVSFPLKANGGFIWDTAHVSNNKEGPWQSIGNRHALATFIAAWLSGVEYNPE